MSKFLCCNNRPIIIIIIRALISKPNDLMHLSRKDFPYRRLASVPAVFQIQENGANITKYFSSACVHN